MLCCVSNARCMTYPWTLGNFSDALRSEYVCKVYETDEEMLGYAVLMLAMDEAELLDIAIDVQHQHQGMGATIAGGDDGAGAPS